ncbi:lactate racemase domain-containing protein [Pseudofrankia sp. BMG5.37]|uniref:lactate racemase domain-containing protein n=1 Tax=Pseudofrankia sp. BMG5.37 TaxID=3050035 RepID=UPI002895DBE8|nr:lactate racemase domain-containing protein [Pseudofrankia sp. BMG5.37]MDT3439165.1 lactate racemase domain-containing protein [Pseudofrankia sp. BMG5.37]
MAWTNIPIADAEAGHVAGPFADTADQATIIGGPTDLLADDHVAAFIHEQLAAHNVDGRSVCVIVPDGTRSCPLPLLLSAVHGALTGRASRLTTLVALGTHAAMTQTQLARHLGHPAGNPGARYPGMEIRNHEWRDPRTFVSLGTIPAERVAEISEGRLRENVAVRLNRAVVEHDVALVVGPVFPHEVVGFSGGNKYFFPGVAGPEVIDLSHWLGALITSAGIIGRPGTTPVRALIDEAAALIPAETLALCVVARSGSGALHAAAFGEPRAAWAAAAKVSAATHVSYLDAPVRRVLSVMPEKYDDIWTAAKGFYKLEPVVADGGEVILYAPHITQVAGTHPEILDIGYHCRDYFMKQWDRYRHVHRSVLAHSTHLRGAGTYDERAGERCRVRVTLATGIPEDIVRAVNLDYLDPAQVDVAACQADPETFVVPDAGEILFRLR